jgi:hypothetical protein
MTGVSARLILIGRRPRDYLEYLPKPRRMRVIDRIRRAYRHHFASLGEDCAQEACARLLASENDLRIGPEATNTPTSEWYDAAENALVRFATGLTMRRSVVRDMYSGKGLDAPDYWLSRDDVAVDDGDVPPGGSRSTIGADSSEGEQIWIDEQLHWTKVVRLLRERLAQQPTLDAGVLQVFDQLCRNAAAFERCSVDDGESIPDIVRGESFQINHGPLLESLKQAYPDAGWDVQKLRLKISDLGRDALRIEEALAKSGVVLFAAVRRGKSPPDAKKVEQRPEDHVSDLAGGDPLRGALS